MQAFHNDARLKEATIQRLRRHMEVGELVPRERFWEDGKGGPAGCAVHDGDPLVYERELGIPRMVLPLMEALFVYSQRTLGPGKGDLPAWMSAEEVLACRTFPIDWLEAIRVGADLQGACGLFILWQLTDPRHGVLARTTDLRVRNLLEEVVAAHRAVAEGNLPSQTAWADLRKRALALRREWSDRTLSAAAAAVEFVATASWPQVQGGGRVAEEALHAYSRLADCIAAFVTGWADAEEEQVQRNRDELVRTLESITETDKATVEAKRSAAVAVFQHRMETELATVSARKNAHLEEGRKQRWFLLSECRRALLRIVRDAPVAA